MKNGIYLLKKDRIEEKEFEGFGYTPDGYWDEIDFDETPVLITRTKKKRKAGGIFHYEIRVPLIGDIYITGWELEVSIDLAERFEKGFCVPNDKEWVKKLELLLSAKRMKKVNDFDPSTDAQDNTISEYGSDEVSKKMEEISGKCPDCKESELVLVRGGRVELVDRYCTDILCSCPSCDYEEIEYVDEVL